MAIDHVRLAVHDEFAVGYGAEFLGDTNGRNIDRVDVADETGQAQLAKAVIADAAERGVARLHLEVRRGNPAIALYAGHGFAQVGERRAYYRSPCGERHDALTFARDL